MKKASGFVQVIVLIVIGLIIASLLGFDLKTFFDSDSFQKNLSYVLGKANGAWNDYFKPAGAFVWKLLQKFNDDEENAAADNDVEIQSEVINLQPS